jgi:argininosuccinate lyase
MKGLPSTYNRDMQEDKPPLFDAADQLSGSLEMMQAVIDSARLNPARPAIAVEESWAVATDLAEALARHGTEVATDLAEAPSRHRTTFHAAHHIVGRLVLESTRAGKKPSDWTAAELAAFDPAFTPAMIALMKPAEGMKTREIHGGTGPTSVAAALDRADARVSAWRK